MVAVAALGVINNGSDKAYRLKVLAVLTSVMIAFRPFARNL